MRTFIKKTFLRTPLIIQLLHCIVAINLYSTTVIHQSGGALRVRPRENEAVFKPQKVVGSNQVKMFNRTRNVGNVVGKLISVFWANRLSVLENRF